MVVARDGHFRRVPSFSIHEKGIASEWSGSAPGCACDGQVGNLEFSGDGGRMVRVGCGERDVVEVLIKQNRRADAIGSLKDYDQGGIVLPLVLDGVDNLFKLGIGRRTHSQGACIVATATVASFQQKKEQAQNCSRKGGGGQMIQSQSVPPSCDVTRMIAGQRRRVGSQQEFCAGSWSAQGHT